MQKSKIKMQKDINSKEELIREIQELKRKKEAVILVHNYQRPEIYKVADFIGDSLELSQAAARTKAKIIVFCGVDFMAESAKILNPQKKVLLPVLQAKCPMAGQVKIKQLKKLQKKHPDAATVCYINTTAQTKAISDICCTSANCIKVVNSLPQKKIIFVPDKNLADYLRRHTDKEIIAWPGFCYVHQKFLAREIKKMKKLFPKAKVIAHPECPPKVIDLADYVCSTSQMINKAKESTAQEFIILTERGMIERLKQLLPQKKFYTPSEKICLQMKKTTLSKVRDSLLFEKYEVNLPEDILQRAKNALEKMLTV